MRCFYAWNRMKVYLINVCDLIQFVGLLWLLVEYFSDKFSSIFLLFLFLSLSVFFWKTIMVGLDF